MFGKFINPKLVYISYEYGDVLMVSKKSGWYGIFHRYLHFSMTNGRVSYSTAMSHQSHISIPSEKNIRSYFLIRRKPSANSRSNFSSLSFTTQSYFLVINHRIPISIEEIYHCIFVQLSKYIAEIPTYLLKICIFCYLLYLS